MNLLNKFQYVFVISLITSSFSTGGAEVSVESCELHVCEGRSIKPCDPSNVPQDCYDIQQLCGKSVCSGLYNIYPEMNGDPLQVYCDMKTDGGGWLVFQRRQDGREDFGRGWNEYKLGFGTIAGEFWWGNEHLHKLTEHNGFELRVELEDFDGERRYAIYDNFEIKSEGEKYQLILGAYSGNAGDSLSFNNGAQFSTKDLDNDTRYSDEDCVEWLKGAWWHYSCTKANLNGLYLAGFDDYKYGMFWYDWRGNFYSMKETEMKIRPKGVGKH